MTRLLRQKLASILFRLGRFVSPKGPPGLTTKLQLGGYEFHYRDGLCVGSRRVSALP